MLQSTGVVAQAECTASSRHSSAASLIRRGLYDDLHSFAELEQRIAALGAENTKIVGDAFEIFVEAYLATHQKLQVDTVWLVGQVPLEIRKQLNLPKDVKGIDGVFRTRIGSLVPYQVKFRSNRNYLTYTEIAPFLGLTERASDRIVFTNSNELAEDVKNRDAMRTVRGIDFDDLTEDDFRAICGWLRKQPVAIPKPTPHPYQTIALEKIAETFAKSNRAHVVMACGTGKTLVALWAVEQFKSKTVLVLVPSLTLLQQTLDEWSRHNSWGNAFSFICVCSDPTVSSKDENDPITFHRTDAEFRVDTDPNVVRSFITKSRTSIKIIFATYQSSPIVSEGLHGLPPLDIAVFDEAHKTTGPKGGLFAHCLSDENIRIRKRLFLTATPRHYDVRHRDREGDFRIISMDDETVYGPRAYTLTFGSAAHQGIICNYKVVISVVDGQEVNEFALKHGITLVKGDLIGARWVANQIAVERAIERTGAVRGITFHSRVSSAKEFASDTPRGIQQWLPDFSVFHVNGTQRSSERKQLIRSFRHAKKSLITNARCLTEGIDVPAVDMVAFIDPRHSRIDIAQATGRAMRKPHDSHKTVGYIVIPLFLERRAGETLDDALDRSDFSDVASVLNAIQEEDEDLVNVIRELQEAKGRGDVFDMRRLSDKVEVLGPTIDLSTLRINIFAEIVDAIGVTWDQWYGRLKAYKDREGHCRVPASYSESGFGLGGWVVKQRADKDRLVWDRRQRLDATGFIWDPLEADWEEGFHYLNIYKAREGHCRVPDRYIEGDFGLGRWVQRQRPMKRKLSEDRRRRLNELGFIWDPFAGDWEEGFNHLKRYKEREGHCRVRQDHLENSYRLGVWVGSRRADRNTMPAERRQRLEELGFVWDTLSERWVRGFTYLTKYQERNGHCRVPITHKEDNFRLGGWVREQRTQRNTMPSDRRQLLERLRFVWDPLTDRWDEYIRCLAKYTEREGHCRVTVGYKEGNIQLGNWVHNLRKNRQDTLSEDRRQQLAKLGFVWDAAPDRWERGFDALTVYKRRVGHCRVPGGHNENGFPLGNWVGTQRARKERLPTELRQRLDAIGFAWDPQDADWEDGFCHLKTFKQREGHCRIPPEYKEGAFRLGRWVRTQRASNGIMSPQRQARLDELGFVWDYALQESWEKGFNYLKIYKEREGHCRVPQDYNENGFTLGQWVGSQRHRINELSEARRRRLDDLGFVWDPRGRKWEDGVSFLRTFKKREGHCRVAKSHKEDGFPLGQWVSNQRTKGTALLKDQRQWLQELGFVWDALSDRWDEGFNYLKSYRKREGHCRVPKSHKEDGFPLGQWVNCQRTKRTVLSKERRQRLGGLGFVWDAPSDRWDEGFNYLKTYKDREGHCLVPQCYKENGYGLGLWVSGQRTRRNTMPKERRQRLEELGFVWKVR